MDNKHFQHVLLCSVEFILFSQKKTIVVTFSSLCAKVNFSSSKISVLNKISHLNGKYAVSSPTFSSLSLFSATSSEHALCYSF